MGLINKVFGLSKLQEEFRKSRILELKLEITSIEEIEFSINGNQIKKLNSLTNIIFDFENQILFISGDLFEELFDNSFFYISSIIDILDTMEIYISLINSNDVIFMKCIVYRNHILFQGNLSNWNCKISKRIKISH
jgi:hypothetical protein